MTLNLQAVREVVESMRFSTDARDAFGAEGEACLRCLLDSVRTFFQAVPPDGMSTTFVFVCWVGGQEVNVIQDGKEHMASSVSVTNLSGYRQRMEDAPVVVVGVRSDGRYDLAAVTKTPQLEEMSERSLVFVNEGGVDRFVVRGRSTTLPQLAIGARSNFAMATVSDLEEALESYRQLAAEVSCPILAEVWEGGRDGPRLVFRNKPEATMRRSLGWFLSVKMEGDVCVRPEHNTDESKPVDLVVNWFESKQRALIEIKWLGNSLTKDSDGTRFTSYSASRVGDGADQLADYLDREQSTDPSVSLRGYLAVFDGRRRNVVEATTPIARTDALYYREEEVELAPEHVSGKTGIAALKRFFLEPRQSLFAPMGHAA